MIKGFVTNLIFSASIVAIFLYTYFDGDMKTQNISDALFVIGLFMFFMGLISMTKAREVFIGFKYTFKTRFSRKFDKSKSYYDYSAEQKKNSTEVLGIPMFIIGIIYIAVSYYLALA